MIKKILKLIYLEFFPFEQYAENPNDPIVEFCNFLMGLLYISGIIIFLIVLINFNLRGG